MASILFKLAGGLALLVGATLVQAQDIQERTIRFGHLNNTDHPTSWGVKKFAEIVAAKSGGKIKVQEFPSSQLSYWASSTWASATSPTASAPSPRVKTWMD